MDEANLAERTIAAPTVLDLASRDRFQRAAIALLDEMPRGSGYLTVDLTEIHCLDASVLSALAVIQQRAADYGLAIRLKNASDDVRFSLILARLEDRFELTGPE